MKTLLFALFITVVICGCSNNSTEPKYEAPTEGLIAYYPFNMNIVDESENDLDGSENNGCIPINDRFNNPNSAFYFDGDDNYIILQNIENYFPDGVTEYSFSLWFLPATEDFNVILCDIENISYLVKIYDNIKAKIYHNNWGNPHSHTLTSFIEDYNNWQNAIFTVSIPNNEIKFYINGELEDIENEIYSLPYLDNWLIVGGENDHGTIKNFFNGIIDDIRIYNKALSSSEVTSIYHENGWD